MTDRQRGLWFLVGALSLGLPACSNTEINPLPEDPGHHQPPPITPPPNGHGQAPEPGAGGTTGASAETRPGADDESDTEDDRTVSDMSGGRPSSLPPLSGGEDAGGLSPPAAPTTPSTDVGVDESGDAGAGGVPDGGIGDASVADAGDSGVDAAARGSGRQTGR